MNISRVFFWPGKLTGPFFNELYIKKIKEKKCILNSERQNAILVNVLMYIQILINISYDLMHISCPQCGHVVWDIEHQ